MIREEKLVIFVSWPDEGADAIHPEDLALARKRIPGERIYRVSTPANYGSSNIPLLEFRHGEEVIRARPLLWREVRDEGLSVGDWVEVKSLWGKNDPFVGQIAEMIWDEYAEAIRYRLRQTDMVNPKLFGVGDLILLERWKPEAPLEVSSPQELSGQSEDDLPNLLGGND